MRAGSGAGAASEATASSAAGVEGSCGSSIGEVVSPPPEEPGLNGGSCSWLLDLRVRRFGALGATGHLLRPRAGSFGALAAPFDTRSAYVDQLRPPACGALAGCGMWFLIRESGAGDATLRKPAWRVRMLSPGELLLFRSVLPTEIGGGGLRVAMMELATLKLIPGAKVQRCKWTAKPRSVEAGLWRARQ